MKAPDVIHVDKRADSWLIRDRFFICIANSFLKNRQNAKCTKIKNQKKRKLIFLFFIVMWDNQLGCLELMQQPFLPSFEYKA